MCVIFKGYFRSHFFNYGAISNINLFWNGQTQCFQGKHPNVIYCLNKNYVNVAMYMYTCIIYIYNSAQVP